MQDILEIHDEPSDAPRALRAAVGAGGVGTGRRAGRLRLRGLLPSALTCLRMPLGALFLLAEPRWWGPILVVAAVTDVADGALARHLGADSRTGALLDGAADKVFVLLVLIALVTGGWLQTWQAALLLSRDVVVVGVALGAVVTRRWAAFGRMQVRRIGKLSTTVTFAAFLSIAYLPQEDRLMGLLLTCAIAVSLAAAFDYLRVLVAERTRCCPRGG